MLAAVAAAATAARAAAAGLGRGDIVGESFLLVAPVVVELTSTLCSLALGQGIERRVTTELTVLPAGFG